MLLRNTFYTFLLLVVCLFSCDTKKTKQLDNKFQQLYEQATNQYKYGDLDGSHLTFLELLSITDEVSSSKENQRIHLIALNYLGDINLKAGDEKLAYQRFIEALELANKYNNESYQIQAILNMALLEKNPQEAERTLLETSRKFKQNKENKFSLDQIRYALGVLYAKNGRQTEALDIFNELLQENYPDSLKSDFYKASAISYREKGDFKSAINKFDKAIELSENSNRLNKLNILVEKIQTYSMSKDYNKAQELIENIKPAVDTIQDLELKKKIYNSKLDIYTKTKNTKDTNRVLFELLSLNEKIYKKTNAVLGSITVNLKNLELIKETDSHKKINKLLKMMLLLVFFLFLIVTFKVILFYKLHKKQTQLKLKLLKKEQAYKDLQNEKDMASINAYMNGQQEERFRQASKLHDVIGANLSAVNLHLNVLKADLPEEKFIPFSDMLRKVMSQIRDTSHEILPPIIVNQGIIAAITQKAEEWTCENLKFEISSNVKNIKLNRNMEIDLYKGILECMNNIISHAAASKVNIKFQQIENNTLNINIEDDGQGFNVQKIKSGEVGLGLNGFKNRIQYFKGDLEIYSKIGNGTKININVPVMIV